MADQEKQGDSISAQISGAVSGQAAVGKGITQTQSISSGSGEVTEADLAELRKMIADLKTQIGAQAPADKRDAALERVDELQTAVTAKKPDLSTMEYVKSWFVKNLPALAGTVAGVVVHPIVGRLVAAAGDALVADFRHRFGPAS